MKIKIYQINLDRDEEGVAFESLEWMENHHFSLDSTIYDTVFDGEVDGDTLEDVFRTFNIERPEDFKGRSLSVSDIVEVVEPPCVVGIIETESGPITTYQFTDYASYVAKQEILRDQGHEFVAHDCMGLKKYTIEPGCYFCDSIGFQMVEFDTQKAQEMKKDKTIKVVLVEPGKEARIAEIDSSLAGMQRIVGGMIEPFYPFEESVCIVCNDEGKISGLPLNRAIREEPQQEDLSYNELRNRFREAETSGKHMVGYVTFTEDSFDRPYSEKSRTYVFGSDNKAFQPDMGGYSIFASALDGSDPCVRLDGLMAAEHGGKDGWKIERCYVMEESNEIIDIIAGTFFICDCSGENFDSLSEEQLQRFSEKYKNPEHFIRMNGVIQAIPYKYQEQNYER